MPCYNHKVMLDTSSWLCDGTWQRISSDAHTMAKVVELHETSVQIDMSKIQKSKEIIGFVKLLITSSVIIN